MLVFMNAIETAPEQSKFISIYERYKNLMYYVAYRILQNHEDAEEAVNDALWQVAQNLNQISDPDGPRTKRLIVIITERKAIDLYRKNRRHPVVPLEDWAESTGPEVQDGLTVATAINRLPPDYREVILLRFADGYSVREIAHMLDYTVSKVEKLIIRGHGAQCPPSFPAAGRAAALSLGRRAVPLPLYRRCDQRFFDPLSVPSDKAHHHLYPDLRGGAVDPGVSLPAGAVR